MGLKDRSPPPHHPFPEGSGIHFRSHGVGCVLARTAQNQRAVAEARSTETPGPMVEDSETFLR